MTIEELARAAAEEYIPLPPMLTGSWGLGQQREQLAAIIARHVLPVVRKAELWERLHDARTKAAKADEAELRAARIEIEVLRAAAEVLRATAVNPESLETVLAEIRTTKDNWHAQLVAELRQVEKERDDMRRERDTAIAALKQLYRPEKETDRA